MEARKLLRGKETNYRENIYLMKNDIEETEYPETICLITQMISKNIALVSEFKPLNNFRREGSSYFAGKVFKLQTFVYIYIYL